MHWRGSFEAPSSPPFAKSAMEPAAIRLLDPCQMNVGVSTSLMRADSIKGFCHRELHCHRGFMIFRIHANA